jgi:hypothetical protein
MIHADEHLQSSIRDALIDLSPRNARNGAEIIRMLFTNLDGIGIVDDMLSAFDLFGVDPDKVDWKQLAELQISKIDGH